MGFWAAVVLVTLIISVTIVMLAKYGSLRRGGEMPATAPQNDAQIAALRAELGLFKDRIAVLERIATENDRGLMLDREIASLRSLPVE